jgi:hypothetical protein
MTRDIIPQKLAGLHSAEEQLRQKARSMLIPLDVAHHSGMISPTVPI